MAKISTTYRNEWMDVSVVTSVNLPSCSLCRANSNLNSDIICLKKSFFWVSTLPPSMYVCTVQILKKRSSHNAEVFNALFLLENSFLSKVVSNGPVWERSPLLSTFKTASSFRICFHTTPKRSSRATQLILVLPSSFAQSEPSSRSKSIIILCWITYMNEY